VKPEIAACNAGTLNYLKLRDDGRWAWPPMVFDNPVEKVQAFLDVMNETGTRPEFECFDVGIVRSVAMYRKAAMSPQLANHESTTSSWAWPRACRSMPTCCPAAALDRTGLALADHADRPRKSGHCTSVPPNSAACCAAGWKTASTCPTAARHRAMER
jgi:hypothetical protein